MSKQSGRRRRYRVEVEPPGRELNGAPARLERMSDIASRREIPASFAGM